MADELVKSGTKAVAKKAPSALMKHAKKAAKKHAKKAAKHAGAKTVGAKRENTGEGLRTAFHHMQRAAVVISLMEKGTGEDLRELLERGVKLYGKAVAGKGDGGTLLTAIGVLRAAEHLAMAGLYDARHKHRERVEGPDPRWMEDFLQTTSGRLKELERGSEGKGASLVAAAEELVRRAEDAEDDPHLAYELGMAADALCFAQENGL